MGVRIQKMNIKGSPFLGVFCRTTNKITLIPHDLTPNEHQLLKDTLGTELVACSLAASSLLGILAIGNQHGFVVPELAEKNELEQLQHQGVPIQTIPGVEALGNLVAVNDTIGFYTQRLVHEKTVRSIEKTLKIKLEAQTIAQSELVGSGLVLNNHGFVCHSQTTTQEAGQLERKTRLKGNRTTANLGDAFIGNSILANDHGTVVGWHSTPFEMMAIEEAFSGEA